jgi:hypothetical protein
MAKSFGKKRPTFHQFRNLFFDVLKAHTGEDTDPFSPWLSTGDEKKRALILAAFRDRLIEEFNMGKDLQIKQRLMKLEGPVESVITQLFHAFSTLSLVEHINETVLEQQEARRQNNK